MYRILVADPLRAAGLDILREAGAEVIELDEAARARLPEMIAGADALLVRSQTQVTAELLEHADRLKVVARAGIGTDNVDVAAATARGVLVVNAPTANLVSATEHTFALLLSLTRKVSLAHESMRRGEWSRGEFMGTELRGKTIGIIGFGRIGQAVAKRAAAFEMEVIAADPFLDAAVATRFDIEMTTIDDLVARADVVTLHTPLTDQTENLLSAERIQAMKPGALLINCARGGIVDDAALLSALDDGRLGGAALDVFAEEPPTDWTLVRHPLVVTTPHIGAQTVEAQERVATDTARMVLGALEGSLAVTAVNLPFRSAGHRSEAYLSLTERMARMASQLLGGRLGEISVDLWGIDDHLGTPLAVAAAKGALFPALGDRVNYVNASGLARDRGIEVVRSTHGDSDEYPHLIAVTVRGSEGAIEIAGSVFGEDDPRVVRYGGYPLEFRPEGRLLVLRNKDVPGVVGKLGTTLGDANVNIAEIHLARLPEGDAIAVIRIDEEPGSQLIDALCSLPEVDYARLVELETP
jgi:D-3-phosphoglycerate dehydrogenase